MLQRQKPSVETNLQQSRTMLNDDGASNSNSDDDAEVEEEASEEDRYSQILVQAIQGPL